VGVGVIVEVAVWVGVGVPVADSVIVGVALEVGEGEPVGVSVGRLVAVFEGVADGDKDARKGIEELQATRIEATKTSPTRIKKPDQLTVL